MAVAKAVAPILLDALTGIFKQRSVPVPTAKAEQVATEVLKEVKKDPDIAIVPVESAFKSKINWFNSFVVGGVLSYFGYNVPTSPEEWLTLAAGLIVPVGTIVLKTFFSKSVTAQSVK